MVAHRDHVGVECIDFCRARRLASQHVKEVFSMARPPVRRDRCLALCRAAKRCRENGGGPQKADMVGCFRLIPQEGETRPQPFRDGGISGELKQTGDQREGRLPCLAKRGAGLSMFVLGRTAGWIGHAIEQYRTGLMIRPRARYTGEAPR